MKGGRLFTEKCLIMIHVPVIPQKYTVHSQSLILVLEFSTHNSGDRTTTPCYFSGFWWALEVTVHQRKVFRSIEPGNPADGAPS